MNPVAAIVVVFTTIFTLILVLELHDKVDHVLAVVNH